MHIRCIQTSAYFDCINRPTALIDKAIEMGLSGIAITDHECLSAHMEVNQYAKKIKDKYPNLNLQVLIGSVRDSRRVNQVFSKYKPEIVLCNAIDDRHIDHGKGSKLVSDACFLSGLMKIETSLDGEKQSAWRPKLVYHYIQWKNIEPDFVVDITGFTDKKIESILAYGSQFYDANSKEPITPITSKNFLESLNYRSQDLGRLVGVDYAEGFTVERCLAVNSLGNLL